MTRGEEPASRVIHQSLPLWQVALDMPHFQAVGAATLAKLLHDNTPKDTSAYFV